MCSLSTCQVNDFIKEKLGQVVLVLNAEFTYTSWQEVLTTLEGDKKQQQSPPLFGHVTMYDKSCS